MGITYNPGNRMFHLKSENVSYLMGLVDEEGFLAHAYYGRKLGSDDITYLFRTENYPFVPSRNARERLSFLDRLPMEYPVFGMGDFRDSCLEIHTPSGAKGVTLSFSGYEIMKGKPELSGLPHTFGSDEECQTLIVHLKDEILELEAELFYTCFEHMDVITRSVRITNHGEKPIYLDRVMSAGFDMENRDYDMMTLHGSWARERAIQRKKTGFGRQGLASVRGESSHQDHPFLALLDSNASDECGDVYAMHFVYSGNFTAEAMVSQFNTVRMMMGINPDGFCWKLACEESFSAPEVVMVYSDEGVGKMTRTFHDLYRKHLIRSLYKDQPRPVLINNWEATYFDFTTEKLLSIAKEASTLGIEMLVMDDGWFGNRKDDNSSLGDWKANEEKLPGGLPHLVREVNKLGMKFGIWMEPEMVSPDSDLYRAHPDWAIAIPGRKAALSRNQYVLDISRKEVADYVYECVYKTLKSANIEYLKWDMNRQLTDLYSVELPADRQGELYHRYVLAMYSLQERLMQDFPKLLLENCSGGGARFDPGMLYYCPQIWCSDDTDAVERLKIQEGTALLYPLSTMGAHVSDCPNHCVGRVTPFETRGIVALAGTFGYELDVTRISQEERNQIPGQIARYHNYHELVRTGDYYRIASYSQNHEYDCYEIVSKDKSKALVTYVRVLNRPNMLSEFIRLKGLDAKKHYLEQESQKVYRGDVLMQAGLPIPGVWGDFQAKLFDLVETEV